MEKFVYEKHTFQDVKDKFENYIHNSDDIKRIEFAFDYASIALRLRWIAQ